MFIRTLAAELLQIKKDYGKYTLFYFFIAVGAQLLPTAAASVPALQTSVSFLSLSLSLLQIVNLILFQRAYTKQKIGMIAFTPIPAVIANTYFIYFAQMLLFLFPAAGILGMISMTVPKTFAGRAYVLLVGRGGLLILMAWWLMRLIFVPMILVYQKESMRMKLIISESKAIFRKHYRMVIPFFLILYLSALYTAYQIVNGKSELLPPLVNTGRIIILIISGYISSLLYCKFVIDYQLLMAQRFLPDKR